MHRAANAGPVPVQDANSANARLPTVSRSVTRSPFVTTWVQVCPPAWLPCTCGPNAHPSRLSRNRTWPTPAAPSAGPVTGAGTPLQVFPASSVRAPEVQSSVAQFPGVPAWPITHPVCVPMNVTELGRKLAGTGGRAVFGTTDEAAADAVPALPLAEGTGVAERPLAAGAADGGLSTGRLTICGTATAAATITAAAPAPTASRRYLRRRARFLIRSKVPGGGGSGSTRPSSQESRSSRRSGIAFPQRGLQLGPRREQVGLDRALGPVQQRRDLPDREPAVVVEQERVAQPRRQRGQQVPHVHVLDRIGQVVQRARGHAADGPPLAFGLAPVVADQVGGDHIEIA